MTKAEEKLVRSLEEKGILTRYENRRYLLYKLFCQSIDGRRTEKNRQKAREELILINTRYVLYAIRKLIPEDYLLRDDLIQIGIIQLIKYIDETRENKERIAFFKKEKRFVLRYLFIQMITAWKAHIFDEWTMGATEMTYIYNLGIKDQSISELIESETNDEYWRFCYNGQLKKGLH